MGRPEPVAIGFALAAVAARDRGAKRARPGLSPALWAELSQAAQALQALTRAERGQRIATWWPKRPVPAATQPEARNMRALSLLCAEAPDAAARQWLLAAGLPRPGYEPPSGLLALLRTLAEAEALA